MRRERGYLVDFNTGAVMGMNVKPTRWHRFWLAIRGVRWFQGEPR